MPHSKVIKKKGSEVRRITACVVHCGGKPVGERGCVCVCVADKCVLKDPDGVERCQVTLVDAMEFMCSSRGSRDRLRLGRILGLLADIRALSDRHIAWQVKIGMDWSGELRIPALLYEIFSG